MNEHPKPKGGKPLADKPTKSKPTTGIGLKDAIRDQMTGYVDRRKAEMAGFLSELAKALRGGGEGLDAGAQGRTFVEGVADGLDALSQDIDRRGLGELYRDVEGAARRHPEAALALAAVAGFTAFRLLRSTAAEPVTDASERHRQP